jgi:hypothetical protein
LYIDLIWFLTGAALENYFNARNPFLHPWAFAGSADVVLNEIGILIVCGFGFGGGKMQKWLATHCCFINSSSSGDGHRDTLQMQKSSSALALIPGVNKKVKVSPESFCVVIGVAPDG